jgi:radical SAM superfamily enzyme YgiQ (UPF0313 family)
MKISLIHPTNDILCHEIVFGLKAPPLGLSYIASYLEDKGHEIEIIDMSAKSTSIDRLRSRLETSNPDMVGIYCSIARVKQSLNVAHVAKSLGAEVVFGGPHATAYYETILENKNVDVVIRGEGEETFAKLAARKESNLNISNVKGIAFKDNNEITVTPPAPLIYDLDTLPFPAFHLLQMKNYKICGNIQISTLTSSRGCSRKCPHCIVPEMYQGIWRGKNPSRVVDEMEFIHSTYKPNLLLFFDEFFTEDLDRVERITEEIRSRGLDIKWACLSTAVDTPKELMIKMQKAGCFALFFGIDCEINAQPFNSFTARNRDIFKAFSNAHQSGLFPIANVVFGFPGETKINFETLLRNTIELDPDHALFFKAVPYSEFQDYELDQMEKEAYKSFYKRKSYILKHLARSVSRAVRFRNFSIDFMWKYSKWFFKAIKMVKSF